MLLHSVADHIFVHQLRYVLVLAKLTLVCNLFVMDLLFFLAVSRCFPFDGLDCFVLNECLIVQNGLKFRELCSSLL